MILEVWVILVVCSLFLFLFGLALDLLFLFVWAVRLVWFLVCFWV